MTSSPAGAKYASPTGLLFRQWPDEEAAVVFVPATTSTHLVSAVAGLVLQAAAQAPASLETIAQALDAAVGAADDAAEDGPGGASQPSNLTLAQTRTIIDGLVDAGLLHASP